METDFSDALNNKKKGPSFFSIQVSAFREQKRANKAVLQWKARDYESFYLLPDQPNGTFNRVFVGRFPSLNEANVMATKIEEIEKNKVFITLIDASQKRYP